MLSSTAIACFSVSPLLVLPTYIMVYSVYNFLFLSFYTINYISCFSVVPRKIPHVINRGVPAY